MISYDILKIINTVNIYFGNESVKGMIFESLTFTSSHSLFLTTVLSFHKSSCTEDMMPNQAYE